MICLSGFCFALMGLFVGLASELPATQKLLFRNAVASVITLPAVIRYARHHHDKWGLNAKNAPFLLLRTLFGTLGILANFYALSHLPLSDAAMLNKLAPFATLLFSAWWLKEKLKLHQLLCILMAFLSSLLIIKPSFNWQEFVPSLVGVAGGLLAGAAYTLLRKTQQMGVNSTFIVFFFSFVSCLLALPLSLPVWKSVSPENAFFFWGLDWPQRVDSFALRRPIA